jgi:hypothetical protein
VWEVSSGAVKLTLDGAGPVGERQGDRDLCVGYETSSPWVVRKAKKLGWMVGAPERGETRAASNHRSPRAMARYRAR